MHNREEYWTMYCENVDLRKCRMNFTPLCPKSFMSYKKKLLIWFPLWAPVTGILKSNVDFPTHISDEMALYLQNSAKLHTLPAMHSQFSQVCQNSALLWRAD